MVQANARIHTSRLHYFTLRVAYYHALWGGFLPALYNWHNGELYQSRFYLLYSAAIQFCFALGTLYIYKGYLERSTERFDDKVIHWTDIMTNAGRYLTFAVLCLYIWTRRQNMIKLWEELWRLDSLYAQLLPSVDGHLSMRTRWLTIYYFWSPHIVTPLTSLYVLLQFPRQINEHVIMAFASWAQSTFQVMLVYYTLVIHCHFIQKYQTINGELKGVLRALACGRHNETRVRLRKLTQRLSLLVTAHFEYLRCTLRVLRFGQLTFLLILIKCFLSFPLSLVQMDHFSAYLCCNRLRYTVCGLFEIDLPQCVTFFFVVLVQVTVLIQFDMEREIGNP